MELASSRLISLRLSAADRVLAAQLLVNEDSRPLRPVSDGGTAGEPTLDSFAILQVVYDVAAWKGWTHSRALHALGPRVSGLRHATTHRQMVSATLPLVTDMQPLFWIEAIDGPWSVYAGNWVRFRARVALLVVKGFAAPCQGQLRAWGNDGDTSIAESRGLVRVECGPGAVNNIWAAAAISAARASGRI